MESALLIFHTFNLTGDGDPSRLEFRADGNEVDYGRGGRIDNITLVETTGNAQASGMEDTAIELPDISAGLTDTDGSESLGVTIGNLPEGSVL